MSWLAFRGTRRAEFVALAAVILLAPGCATNTEELPKTFAAHGKVVRKNGQPLPGGVIMFSSVANPEYRAYGEIAQDGTFTLHTVGHTKNGRAHNLDGAIEGECQVQIEPLLGNGQALGRPFVLRQTYRIEPDKTNEITVVAEE